MINIKSIILISMYFKRILLVLRSLIMQLIGGYFQVSIIFSGVAYKVLARCFISRQAMSPAAMLPRVPPMNKPVMPYSS